MKLVIEEIAHLTLATLFHVYGLKCKCLSAFTPQRVARLSFKIKFMFVLFTYIDIL